MNVKNPPIASIILRSKNESRWLRHLLKNLKQQTMQSHEVILVDNGSVDESRELVESFGGITASVGNYKPGLALNIGCEIANGEYLVFLSSHCIPTSYDWLENLVAEIDDKKALGCVGVYGRQIPTDISSAQTIRDLTITFGVEPRDQYEDPFFHNANSIITKSAWLDIPFDPEISNIEDRIWASKHLANGSFIRYLPSASVAHYHGIHHDNSTARLKTTGNVLLNSGFVDIFPVKHMFENVCVVIANQSSQEILDRTLDVLLRLKEHKILSYIVLVGTENSIASKWHSHIDFQYSIRSSDSYYDSIPSLLTKFKEVGLNFDNCFLMDASYVNRSVDTISKMYDCFLELDAKIMSAVHRETRNYLVVSQSDLPTTSVRFLASSRADKVNDVIIKCSGYCTLFQKDTMVNWDNNDALPVSLFEILDHQETAQVIEFGANAK